MSIQEGDVVLILDDLASGGRYHVKKIKNGIATLTSIAPAEFRFKIEVSEIQKVDKTLQEARVDWSKIHGYSGI